MHESANAAQSLAHNVINPDSIRASAEEFAICAKDLAKRFKKNLAVNGLNIEVPRGSICGFLGPNGAGKTTTIRLLMGLIPPNSGSVRVLGLDPMRSAHELRRRVGYVPDVLRIYKWMTINEVFRFSAAVFGDDWDSAICERLVDRMALPRARIVRQLSRGEMAKLGLIVAMSHRPELLILDEPTTGLDPLVRAEFLQSVAEFTRRGGVTVFFSTHILSDVDCIADHIIVMRDGQAIAQGPLEQLRSRYTKASFLFRTPPNAELRIDGALRVQKGVREWVAVFDAIDEARLRAIARASGASDVMSQAMSVEDIFVDLFDQRPSASPQ